MTTNKQNTEKLFNEFSFFHPEKSLQESLMGFGFECGNGWYDLIYRLCEDIKQLNPPADFEVVQVKEKFGGLRFYVNSGTEEIYNLISVAEEASLTICETCGAPSSGPEEIKGWIHTACEACKKTF